MTVSAVRKAVGHALGVDQEQTLIVDVGGGSTLLSHIAKRRDRHLAKPAAGLDPASRNVFHQRGIAASLGRPVAAAHLQRADHAAKFAALERYRFVRGRGRRRAFRRPRNRQAHRIGRSGDRRPGRFRQVRRSLRTLHPRRTFQTARHPFCRGRNAQSGAAGLPDLAAQDQRRADDRFARFHARRPAAGTGPGSNRAGRRSLVGRA